MLSDIEIAQKNEMTNITDIAAKLGLSQDDIELYGNYKAKISMKSLRKFQEKVKM